MCICRICPVDSSPGSAEWSWSTLALVHRGRVRSNSEWTRYTAFWGHTIQRSQSCREGNNVRIPEKETFQFVAFPKKVLSSSRFSEDLCSHRLSGSGSMNLASTLLQPAVTYNNRFSAINSSENEELMKNEFHGLSFNNEPSWHHYINFLSKKIHVSMNVRNKTCKKPC